MVEPADFARALGADPAARDAYDRLAYSHKREHVRAIESAKKPETRKRRIEKAVAFARATDGNPPCRQQPLMTCRLPALDTSRSTVVAS